MTVVLLISWVFGKRIDMPVWLLVVCGIVAGFVVFVVEVYFDSAKDYNYG